MLTTHSALTDTRQSSLTYLPGLDGLRAFAVMAVLAYHAEVSWMPGGFLGVEVFFVISGYIITVILLNERRRRGRISVRRFYLRRARRLLPALVACVVVTLFAAFLLVPDEVRSLRDDALASLGYVSNWHLVFSDVPYFETFGRPSLFLHIWSLGVEEQFYLLWPLLLIGALFVGGRRAAAVVAVIGILASAVWMAVLVNPIDPNRVYYGTDTRAAGFLLGAALAMWWAPGRLQPSVARSGRWVLNGIGAAAVGAVVVALVLTSEFDLGLYQGGFLVVSLLSAVAIAVAVHPGADLRRYLGAAPLVWIGLRSYGIYLWHFPIFMLTRPGFDVPDWPVFVNLFRVTATLAVAALSYRLIELPVRNGALGRMWNGNRDETKARAIVIGAAFAVPLLAMGVVLVVPAPTNDTSALASESGLPATIVGPSPAAVDVAAPPPTTAPPTAPAAPPVTPVPQGPPLVVGDSVVLGSAAAIVGTLGPGTVVDAVVSRDFHEAIPIIQAWIAAGQNGPIVVHLGSNGPILASDVETVIQMAGLDRRLVLVNASVPRRWVEPVNNELRAAVERHPNVGFVDWNAIVAASPGLLIDDHVHPTTAGRTVLAQAIQSELVAP
ncbi:MAG: acyltransferase family protein [Acidimicrobiales bacterium]